MNIYYLQKNSYEKFLELHSDKLKIDKAKLLATQILNFIKEQQEVCKDDVTKPVVATTVTVK